MADSIKGTHHDDVLRGGSGDDRIYGRGGDDVLYGRSGDDSLYGGAGDDVLHGGSGDDILRGGAGDDVLIGGSGDDVLIGGSGDDILRGGSGDDILRGGSGDDVLEGGSGDDKLFGGPGDDILRGGSGDDILNGGSGDDRLEGGTGDDVLTGGPGDDTFVFSGAFGSDTITDLSGGDKIDLTAITSVTSISDLTIEKVGANTVITLPNGGSITVQGLTPAQVMSHIEVACLMRGTLVRTPAGEIPVERLAIGDEVLTIDGASERIKWIGRRAYSRPFLEHGEKIAPILFAAGSLGDQQPSRPLYVSPEHAVYVDNVLVPAKLLVNETSIRRISDFDMVEYFHLEFEDAQVIWANGAPTESYVDTGNRRMFANYSEYVQMYGQPQGEAGPERGRRFYMIHGGAALAAIRQRLQDHAAA